MCRAPTTPLFNTTFATRFFCLCCIIYMTSIHQSASFLTSVSISQGCLKTLSRFGSRDKRYICLGPLYGQKHHYGHFDILMGLNVQQEVFPLVTTWLDQHDIITTQPLRSPTVTAAPLPVATLLPALLLSSTPFVGTQAEESAASAAAPVLHLCSTSAPVSASLATASAAVNEPVVHDEGFSDKLQQGGTRLVGPKLGFQHSPTQPCHTLAGGVDSGLTPSGGLVRRDAALMSRL